MKTTQATQKIKSIKTNFVIKLTFAIFIFSLISLLLLFVYLSSQYFNLFYSDFILDKLHFLFFKDGGKLQLSINIFVSLLVVLLNVVYIIIIYYVLSNRYQKEFIVQFFDELKLNEIALLERRNSSVNSIIEFSNEILKHKKMNSEHLFSIKKSFNLNFTQMYLKDNHSNSGLLISSECPKLIDGFIDIRFEDNLNIVEMDNKGIQKHIIDTPSKYPYKLFINSNLGVKTSKIINDQIINLIYELRKFTRNKFTLCMHKNKIFIYINGWELRIADSFRQKLTYNSIDKKIDSFTKLVDDLEILYICILRNYEVIKYGK